MVTRHATRRPGGSGRNRIVAPILPERPAKPTLPDVIEATSPLSLAPPPSIPDLFLGYAKAGLMGFGGVAVHARRIIVEERRWLTERDYAEVLGLGQVLPGPNVGNAAILIGRRFHGLPGALAATVGLYAAPLAILIGLMILWRRFGDEPRVAALLHGLACAAAGLVIGNVLRVAGRLRPPPELLAVGVVTVVVTAWLRVPLLITVAVLGPVAVALVWWRRARAAGTR